MSCLEAGPAFVNCVSRWSEGTTTIEEAISRLEEIENKHGVTLVPALPYVLVDGPHPRKRRSAL